MTQQDKGLVTLLHQYLKSGGERSHEGPQRATSEAFLTIHKVPFYSCLNTLVAYSWFKVREGCLLR